MKAYRLSKFSLALCCMTLPLSALGAYSASAAEITGVSKISSVIVFPNGAQVSRQFTVDLPEGEHQLKVNDLPAELQGNSLRVEGGGLENLEIGSIDQRVVTKALRSVQDVTALELLKDQLQNLLDERELAQASVDAAALQKKLLNEMALLPSRPMGRNSEGNGDPVTQYSNLYNLMGDKFIEAQGRAIRAKVLLRKLDKKIRNIKAQIAERPNKRKRATHLTVNVTAGKAGKVQFVVRYQIKGASWSPLYDARFISDDGAGKAKLDLVRRAVIRQRTSEDWSDVQLSLSTTNPTGRTKAPDLFAWLVDFKPEFKKRRPVGGVMSILEDDGISQAETRAQPKKKMHKQYGRVLLAKPAPAMPRRARVQSGQYQMTFDVVGKTTIKRNGERKKVFLDALSLVPQVQLFTVPKKRQKAFLHASFVNKTGNVLIPGAVSLFRDGVYVGRSRLGLVEPDQKAEIGFGIDPKVNVKWVRLKRVKGQTGLLTTSNNDVHRYKIIVANGHKRPMKVTVLDQLPYSEKEQLAISLISSSPKPTRSNVDDKRGVMAWDLTVQANKSRVIEFGYQLTWPKGKSITLR